MNRTEYIHHVLEQKKNMIIDTIDYKQVLEKGKNMNNLPIEAEVIAYFRFENQKILRIHGQVRLFKGDFADADMGMATKFPISAYLIKI